MSFPKILAIVTLFLFGTIFVLSITKGKKKETIVRHATTEEITLDMTGGQAIEYRPIEKKEIAEKRKPVAKVTESELPSANNIEKLFSTGANQFPIVETITYTSRVPWIKGRPAWIADYATHFKTSRFFIARSLTGEPKYFANNIVNGDRFNVFRQDKKFEFHLVIDLSRAKMWFYYHDKDNNERELITTYPVGLGRVDENSHSGYLTPLGVYSLGDRIAIYKPGVMGYFNHEKTEMIRVFGTRWIPFEEEIRDTTLPARGFGLHGIPWVAEETTGKLVEERKSLGKYESDGCVRLATEDIEELYSIVTTQPTYVHLVADFFDAKLPGNEKAK